MGSTRRIDPGHIGRSLRSNFLPCAPKPRDRDDERERRATTPARPERMAAFWAGRPQRRDAVNDERGHSDRGDYAIERRSCPD